MCLLIYLYNTVLFSKLVVLYNNLKYKHKNHSARKYFKMIFRNPDADWKLKLLYAGSKDYLKAAAQGIGITINAFSESDLTEEDLISHAWEFKLLLSYLMLWYLFKVC